MTEEKKARTAKVQHECALRDELDALKAQFAGLEQRLAAFETSAPPQFRRIPPEAVEAIIQDNAFAEFECLSLYKHYGIELRPGTLVRADRFPALLDHVRNGLLLGRPSGADALVEMYRRERAERDAAAKAAAKEAAALAQLAATKAAVEAE